MSLMDRESLTPAAPLAMEGSKMSMKPSMIRNSSDGRRLG